MKDILEELSLSSEFPRTREGILSLIRDARDEIARLRTENTALRHELEVSHYAAIDAIYHGEM